MLTIEEQNTSNKMQIALNRNHHVFNIIAMNGQRYDLYLILYAVRQNNEYYKAY